MEKIPQRKNPKPLDWRSYANLENCTPEAAAQLDMLSGLAHDEGVDFLKKAKDYETGIAGDGQHHRANMLDLLILWGYTRGIITDTEYRALQTEVTPK